MKSKQSDKSQFEDDDHKSVVMQFEEFADGTIAARVQAEKCRDYRDGVQWTSEERETLKKRKQPCITDNKIQDKCDTLLGIEKQMRTDPKALPRNPSPEDEGAAEAATEALRYVADQNQYQRKARKGAADNLMVEGLCAGQVIVEKRKGKYPYICMERIHQDRVYYDIHSREDDFSDKTFCGYFTWMDHDEALAEYPDGADVLEQSIGSQSQTGPDRSLDDKPRYFLSNNKRKRVQVFKHYAQKRGKWMESVWCRGGWLEEPKPCVYVDEFGEPYCCMEIQALYRDADGFPYGSVQRYLDLQDEHNKRRSKMLHLLNAKRLVIQEGQIDDIAQVRTELHKADGVVVVKGDIAQVRVEDNLREAEGQWRLMQQTDAALAATGPNAAIAGVSGDLSGIAKARDQQAGQLPISPLFDALDAWELRMYRQVWCRVRQFWTAQMWIRVTDDEDSVRFVGLNEPVLQGDKLAQMAAQDPEFQQMPDEGKQQIIHAIAQHPTAQQPYSENGKPVRKNDVAQMDMDIIIDRGPDVATLQQEEFSKLLEVAKLRPEVQFKTLVEMSQLSASTKKKVLADVSGENDPAAQQRVQQQQQFEQMMQQLQAALAQANVDKIKSETAKNQAAAEETHVDASVKVAEFTSPPEPGADGEPGKPGAAKPASKTTVSVN